VYCQLEVLRHCFPSSARRILEELPESLDETYERILRDIRKPNQGHAHRLLQCLVAAIRPLRVEELAEVLAFDFSMEGIPKLNLCWRWEDQEEAVMSACSSLVMIVKDGDSQVVQFSHFSVKEFLTADRLAEPIRDVSLYHIRLEAAHTILVRACLGILLQLDDRIDRASMTSFPLARYAAQYWTTHARIENVTSRIKDGMECLFDPDKPHFATWIWIYDEDQWGRSMSTMRPEKPEAVPLYYAAMLGFRDLAEHLIAEYPEHVTVKGGEEVTPLHVAASAGHSDMLSLLIEHGADVNGRGLVGNTPLHRASRNARLEAGQFLLNRGANIDAPNDYNSTALIYSTDWSHAEFARMLLERGAMIDARGIYGRTALHWAAADGQTEVVRLLLERGADAHVRDEDGNTPYKLGLRKGHHETVELLSDYDASSKKKSDA
jgi:Ankyrin repeats (many copies)